MASLVHLQLPRVDQSLPRRKRQGFGGFRRDPDAVRAHGNKIAREVDEFLMEVATAYLPAGVDPSLVLRIRVAGNISDDTWTGAGLSVLSDEANGVVVLFASDKELTAFRDQVAAYRRGIPIGAKSARYAGLVDAIDSVGRLQPGDRIGPALQAAGFVTPDDFVDATDYRLDIEVWDLPSRDLRCRKLDEIGEFIRNAGGEVGGRYVGGSLTLLRVVAVGSVVKALLEMPDIAALDSPPAPDAGPDHLVDLGLSDLDVVPPPSDSPVVGVIDSGLTDQHPLLVSSVVGTFSVPSTLGAHDTTGHGTKVSGVAVYQDIRASARTGRFEPRLRLASARVLNDANNFDDMQLVPSVMRQAIQQLRATYGVRVFNISLADPKRVYAGGGVSSWAAALDELAREFDVVLVVPTGNRPKPVPAGNPDAIITGYPQYLGDAENRLLEPSTAAIAVTVGSVAEHGVVPPWVDTDWHVDVQPVAGANEPSPFSRRGPGACGMQKPDFCDYGGNLMFNGGAQTYDGREGSLSVMTLHHVYVNSLFTFGRGTSLAAPRVAHKAARLLVDYPTATANLLRALLASSATVPAASLQRLGDTGDASTANICGHGIPNFERAAKSDDSRVVLFAEGQIGLDHFQVFEVPIPPEFSCTKGRRKISVTLAFDPPVRHTRKDYLGTRMSFRLLRGKTIQQVTEHFRRPETRSPRGQKAPAVPKLGSFDCGLEPGPDLRDRGTLQRGVFVMSANPDSKYGETYHLVVRCERKWSADSDGPQKFAVVVQIEHEFVVNLYERIELRLRQRVRPRIGGPGQP